MIKMRLIISFVLSSLLLGTISADSRLNRRQVEQIDADNDRQSCRRACRTPKGRPCADRFIAARNQVVGECQTDDDTEELLRELGDRRRVHILSSLKISAISRHHRHDNHSAGAIACSAIIVPSFLSTWLSMKPAPKYTIAKVAKPIRLRNQSAV